MKKIKILLVTLSAFCTFSVSAQEEFFGNKTGISASYSLATSINNSTTIGDGQLSLHLKNGLILAGDYSKIYGNNLYGASIGYLINNNNNDKLKGLLSFSYGALIDKLNVNYNYKITSISFGLMKVLFSNSNFPSSIGASVSTTFFTSENNYSQLQPTAVIGYSQSLFSNNQVYPVIGISKTFVLFNSGANDGNLVFHVGLSVRL